MRKLKNPSVRFKGFSERLKKEVFGDMYEFIPTNSLSRVKLTSENHGIKNIHYGDIHTKFPPLLDLCRTDIPFIKPDFIPKNISERNILQLGDLLFADASEDYVDIGKAVEVIKSDGIAAVSGLHTLQARKKNPEWPKTGYMGNYLQAGRIRNLMAKLAQGTKVLGISAKNINTFPFYLPKVEEQQKIASFLSSVDERIELLERKTEKLDLYKKGVMQQIFSQKIRFK